MLITPFNSKATQLFRAATTTAVPVACRLGSFLLLVIFLSLTPVVYAQAQTEINDTEPSTIFGIAETAPLVVNGTVRFHVVGVTAYPALREMVVIGHSQGGLLTKLTVVDTGDSLVVALTGKDLDSLGLPEEKKAEARRLLVVEPVPEVKRVVFISTPHRGSILSKQWVQNLIRKVVTMPARIFDTTLSLRDYYTEDVKKIIGGSVGPTSIDGMSPESPVLKTLADTPLAPGVVGHSIIAVKGDGDPLWGRSKAVPLKTNLSPYFLYFAFDDVHSGPSTKITDGVFKPMKISNNIFPTLVAAILLSCIVPFAHPAWSQSAQSFSNLYEPSDATYLADGRVIVVEDEGDQPLRLFSLTFNKSELALSPEALKGEKIKVHDIEGDSEGKNGEIFLITSHSTSKKGERKKIREQLIKLTIKAEQVYNIQVVGNLLPFIQKQLKESLKLEKKELEEINIEGVTFDPTKKTLLIGLRSPTHNDKALILFLLNPYDLFSKKRDPIFDEEIIGLDLQGAGIRAITYDKKHTRYLIAGETENKKGKLRSRIWAWDGLQKTRPVRVDVPKIKGVKNIEGLTIVHHEGSSYLLFVCDNGNRGKNVGGRYGFIDVKKL
jgi:hypothetical protein